MHALPGYMYLTVRIGYNMHLHLPYEPKLIWNTAKSTMYSMYIQDPHKWCIILDQTIGSRTEGISSERSSTKYSNVQLYCPKKKPVPSMRAECRSWMFMIWWYESTFKGWPKTKASHLDRTSVHLTTKSPKKIIYRICMGWPISAWFNCYQLPLIGWKLKCSFARIGDS